MKLRKMLLTLSVVTLLALVMPAFETSYALAAGSAAPSKSSTVKAKAEPAQLQSSDEVTEMLKDLPDAEDYNKLTPEEKEQAEYVVGILVKEIEKMTKEEQSKIPQKDIEKLGKLYDTIYNVKIHKDTRATQGLKTHVKEEDIQIYGAGMAAAALGGDVKITIIQELPPDGATMAFELELFLKKKGETEYTRVELKTPIVIKIKLPDSVKAEGLTIYHLNSDGSLKETLTPKMEGRIASFMPTSFSNFLFVEAGSHPSVPGTGDSTNLLPYVLCAGIALIIIVLLIVSRRRK